MSDVTRYDVSEYGGMDESTDGMYVDYDDYAKLQQQLTAKTAECERLRDAGVSLCADIIKLEIYDCDNGDHIHRDRVIDLIYEFKQALAGEQQ